MNLSKIYKVTEIKEKPLVGRIANWVKDLNLKVNDEIEVTVDLSSWNASGHNIRIMNLETGRSTYIMSKAFHHSFMYGNIKISEK